MNSNTRTTSILQSIQTGEEIAPVLFTWENLDLLHAHMREIALEILWSLQIPDVYIYTLEDDESSIKIEDIKQFIAPSLTTPPYPVQIFIIENISRITISAWNSLLKLLEEPGKQNLIFLGNKSESGILDTILSRVQIEHIAGKQGSKKDNFFYSMIEEYIHKKDLSIVSYFFSAKIEKSDYILFLENLLLFSKDSLSQLHLVEKIEHDINMIQKNNVNPKYIVDSYLLLLQQ